MGQLGNYVNAIKLPEARDVQKHAKRLNVHTSGANLHQISISVARAACSGDERGKQETREK